MFNGDWQNAAYDKDLAGNVGFFVFPSATDGGPVAAMSAPLTYGIAAKAKNADCAAFFLNWVATNETARQIDVTVGGSNPGGPTDLAIPPAARGLGHQRDACRRRRRRQGERRDGLHRERHRQHLRAGLDTGAAEAGRRQADAGGLLKAVQAEYEKRTRPVTERRGPTRWLTASSESTNASPRLQPCGPRACAGSAGPISSAGSSSPPRSSCTRRSCWSRCC